ncbi:hypothetical protein HpVH80_11770 [Helicobacter pylori]|uniref:hypothetical protein n=1 Tax=Helicobacter pylori TaxID=210 RepID=UPI0003132220|nr:hypothetical protein [Helicobacter pylori]EQL53285.1 membrane protein [Helicobacter pylori FD506]KNE04121.1 membrane protein [Helicobacter pylori]TPI02623.1 hypothetical protein FIM41_06530 [Helicobacter pylori]UOR24209.1 hypothetical protein MPF87_02955 [Helicobacter pylori]UOS19517.1 hypothetical protein MPG57_04770 [Helicobacter pylori]
MREFLKKLCGEYKSKLFGIYWLRWMLSALVMLPFMEIFYYFNFPLWLNLFLGQTIGAVIFFKLDKLIFSKK